ncbi:MAG: hypothetical protein ACRDJ4_16125 [Actinomycetota bacterium]
METPTRGGDARVLNGARIVAPKARPAVPLVAPPPPPLDLPNNVFVVEWQLGEDPDFSRFPKR